MEVAGYKRSFELEQSSVLGQDQIFQALFNCSPSDPKRAGICTGLSIIWLARRMMWHDETPKKRLDALKSDGGFRFGGKTQDIHAASAVPANASQDSWMDHMFGKALQAYALRVKANSTIVSDSTLAADTLALATSAGRAGVYRLNLVEMNVAGSRVGHTVATYSSGGKFGMMRHFYLFDPNMGEYRLPVEQANAFLTAWLACYKAALMVPVKTYSFDVQR